MAKRFKVVDLDKKFEQNRNNVTFLNDMPTVTEDDRKAINALMMTTYDNTDTLSVIPACQCGRTTMGFNLGKICKSCGTKVERTVEAPIQANLWMRVPEGVMGFIAPDAWIMLTKFLSSTGYNLLEWLTNPMSQPPKNATKTISKKIQVFENAGWKRGLNNFILNFDYFLEIVPQLALTDTDDIIQWLRDNREVIFPKVLPMPTKSLLVLENTAVGAFADLPITGAIDAARTLVAISKPNSFFSTAFLERKTVSIIKNLSTYLWTTIKSNFNGKRGWIRSQLFRSRSHFCMRGVITSISEPHHYEELHIPWAQGLELLKFHIISKLKARGWTASAAYCLVEANGKVYNALLDEIMRELITESEWMGIPCTWQRNPTLTRASMQFFFITRVKTNVEDNTISWSPLCVVGANADFDGDEMNLSLMLDKRLQHKASFLRAHYAIHSLSNLGTINENVSLPDVTVSVWANFLNYDH